MRLRASGGKPTLMFDALCLAALAVACPLESQCQSVETALGAPIALSIQASPVSFEVRNHGTAPRILRFRLGDAAQVRAVAPGEVLRYSFQRQRLVGVMLEVHEPVQGALVRRATLDLHALARGSADFAWVPAGLPGAWLQYGSTLHALDGDGAFATSGTGATRLHVPVPQPQPRPPEQRPVERPRPPRPI